MRVGSLNCNKKLSKDSFTTREVTNFARANNYDILCLQEVGRATGVHFDSKQKLGDYTLYLSVGSGTNLSESCGILVRSHLALRVVRVEEHVKGRLLQIKVQFTSFSFSVFTAYFPTSLESLPIDDPSCISASKMTDILLKSLCQDRDVLIGGDFNECRVDSDRHSGVLGRYRCRFLSRLIGQAGYVDLSSRSRKYTCFRHNSKSKLDRFLASRSIQSRVRKYTVHDGPSFGSDHSLITVDFRMQRAFKPVKDRPEYYRLNFDKFNDKQIAYMRSEIAPAMGNLYNSLFKLKGQSNVSASVLNDHIRCFVNIIHRGYWDSRNLSRPPGRGFTATVEDFLNGAKVSFRYSNAVPAQDRYPDITKLEKKLQTLRQWKHHCNDYDDQILDQEFLSSVSDLVELDLTVTYTSATFGPLLRSAINDTKSVIRQLHKVHRITDTDAQNDLFSSDHKSFYKRYVYQKQTGYQDLSKIYDESIGRVVTDKASVHRVVIREGKKLLCNPPDQPTNPPPWFSRLYEPGCKIRDLVSQGCSWNSLTQSFTFVEIFDAVCCKPGSSPGFDGVGKKAFKMFVVR